MTIPIKLKLGAVIAIIIPAVEADAFFFTMFSAFQEKLNLSYSRKENSASLYYMQTYTTEPT